jgi:hypothetical protein
MAALTDALENSLALLFFNNTNIANVGDATGLRGSTAAGSTQLSLHSVALSDTSTLMTSNELSYTGYARPTQARAAGAGGWTVSGASASNFSTITFGEMTAGGPVTAVYLGVGLISTGSVLHMHSPLQSNLVINNGVNPQFAAGALSIAFA